MLICETCNWRGDETECLSAPNPFHPREIIAGCPDCKSVDQFRTACEILDCDGLVAGSFLIGEGYEWRCYRHSPGQDKI